MNEKIFSYAQKCKHFLPYSALCTLKSTSSNGFHIALGCNLKCKRIEKYARLNGIEITEGMRNEFHKFNNI